MALPVSVGCPNGTNSGIQLDTYPDTCPVCHTSIHPLFLVARALADLPFTTVDAAYQCTKETCRSIIIARYRGTTASTAPFALKSLAPKTAKKTAFSAEITGVSPTFVEVYNQAMTAESVSLDQLVGMGLRKAIEFLVKDFAISQATTEAEKEQIRGKLLGRCIEDHIKDAAVRAAAKRATWLGNDETHYIRRWEDQDITDLRNLVRLTVNAVENAILMRQYETDMPGN